MVKTQISPHQGLCQMTLFQEVSGLSCSATDTIPLEEGGVPYIHQLP